MKGSDDRMSCIYIIKNKVNDKVYIGQTTKTADYRFFKHISSINCQYQSVALCNAFKEIGIENFWVEEIEQGNFTQDELNEKEIYYINKYNSVYPNSYNLQYGGKCSAQNESTKKKLSEKLKGREILWRDAISKTMTKQWENEEYRLHMSKAHKGKRKPYGHVDKPLRIDLPKDEIIEMYNSGMSIYKIANRYEVSYNTIKRRIELWGIK